MTVTVDLLRQVPGHEPLIEGAAGVSVRLTQHQIAASPDSVSEVVQPAPKAPEKDGAIKMERARVLILAPQILERWENPSAPHLLSLTPGTTGMPFNFGREGSL